MGGEKHWLECASSWLGCRIVKMALFRAARRLCSKPVPLGLSGPRSLSGGIGNMGKNIMSFKPGQFFEEGYFWTKANVGPFFILLFLTPTIYRSCKDFYWTRQLRAVSTEEIISDRYEWLRLNMIKDEVEAELLKQSPCGPLELGPSVPL